ncbi:hypothetical protein MHYP_G00288000 [Metynnis hypsauchen]
MIRLSGNGTLKEGDSVNLTCAVNCTLSSPQFVWFKNGNRLHQSGSVLHLPGLTVWNSGKYSCALKNYEAFTSEMISLDVIGHFPVLYIVWIVLGVILFILLVAILAVVYKRRKKAKAPEEDIRGGGGETQVGERTQGKQTKLQDNQVNEAAEAELQEDEVTYASVCTKSNKPKERKVNAQEEEENSRSGWKSQDEDVMYASVDIQPTKPEKGPVHTVQEDDSRPEVAPQPLPWQRRHNTEVDSTEQSSRPHKQTERVTQYVVQQSLGRGSFGSVFLIKDTKAALGEELKVLKEIPLGDLKPDETVKATQEAQLLSQLHHPAILKFYTSFLERDVFCIITEYCEDRDLDCRLEELRSEGKTLSELQVTQWLVQLLLGVNYMHQRRILHRDLKAKNVFLKRNNVKIGDFGVSCLLIGSCDLAMTFTGTPYYMSPEALSHRGYDSKSDIWSLGCILYEMCCLKHAFEGHNFLSMVLKIVEGSTPSLPEKYSQELNALLQRMLEKNPSCRISAADALSSTFLEELTQTVKQQFSDLMLMDRTEGKERDVSQIAGALQKKAADERARKLKKIVEEKYQENHHRMMELRSRHFQKISVNVLKKPEEADCQMQPITDQTFTSSLCGPMGEQLAGSLNMSEKTERDIPDDPQAAEAYYCEDGFESCSDEDDSSAAPSSSARFCQTFGQDSDLEAMVRHMENVLDEKYSIGEAESSDPQSGLQSVPSINTAMAESRIQHIRQSVCQRLGAELFQRVYDYLKEARLRRDSEESMISALGRLVERPADCFEVDQLLYYEEQLQAAQATLTTLTPT